MKNLSNDSSILSKIESPDMTSGIVLGDTGDHHFPKSHSDPKAIEADAPADMLLSEIAEEDLISMMSDKQTGNASHNSRRKNLKPADKLTS